MATQPLDRELKKGSAELLILSLVEGRARHGYEIGKLIDARSQGTLRFQVASLYPLLYRLEARGWIQGRWVEKGGPTPPPFLPVDPRGPQGAGGAAARLATVRGSHSPHYGDRVCLTGNKLSENACRE